MTTEERLQKALEMGDQLRDWVSVTTPGGSEAIVAWNRFRTECEEAERVATEPEGDEEWGS